MSLNWRVVNIKDSDNVCFETKTQEDLPEGETLKQWVEQTSMNLSPWYFPEEDGVKDKTCIRRLNPVTSDLIWATIHVKMGDITEENYGEFYTRYSYWSALFGPTLQKWDSLEKKWIPRVVTVEEIKAHVGLSTNVTEESWMSFLLHMGEAHHNTVRRGMPSGTGRAPSWRPQPAQALGDALFFLDKAQKDSNEMMPDAEEVRHDLYNRLWRWINQQLPTIQGQVHEAKEMFEILEHDLGEEE
jgi:hypothetical protein